MLSPPSPILFQIGPVTIHWYGLFAAIAALVSYALLLKRAKAFGWSADEAANLVFLCIFFGVVGARLEYIRRFWQDQFAGNPWAMFRVWEGGLVFQGGFILALLVAVCYCRHRKKTIGGMGDMVAPVIPAGHAIARVGCLFSGCCFGIPWPHFGGLCYPAQGNEVMLIQFAERILPEEATQPLPVFPVQLAEALCCLLITLLLFWLERRGKFRGRLFYLYLFLYSLARFFLEFLRGDYPRSQRHFGMTPAQQTTLFLILPVALVALVCTGWLARRGNVPSRKETRHGK